MKIINLSEGNSLLNQYVAELRDVHVQNDRMRFRRNIERIGEIMAYEMSKALTYSVKQVQTPLGTATASTHDDKIVIATVFPAAAHRFSEHVRPCRQRFRFRIPFLQR